MSASESAIEASLRLGVDPSRDLPSSGCGCRIEGHRVLSAWLAAQDPAPGAAPAPLWNGGVEASGRVRAALRANGAAFVLSGAEGGWPRGWWVIDLTPAGQRHAVELAGAGAVHAGPGGCGGAWDADLRCERCRAMEPLTIARARSRIAAMAPGEARDREAWASQFVCPVHGRTRLGMVRTDKCCALCGTLLLRRTPVA